MAFNRKKLYGTGVAIVTPFDAAGRVDLPALGRVVEHIVKNKVEYIVALGTTGESVTLSKEEKAAVIKQVVKTNAGRVPVVMGIGGNNTHEIVHTMKTADLRGVDVILSVSPYYNKPSQAGIYEHYKVLSKASPLPIILYNVPGRTSSNLTADTTLRLANDFKNIIGVKEASGNFDQMMRIIKYRPKDFLLISGDDLITLPLMACGAEGVISVVANAYPKDFSEMVRLALAGKYEAARKLHYKLTDITNALFADGSPGGVKAVLEMMKICRADVRLPLVAINSSLRDSLAKMVKDY